LCFLGKLNVVSIYIYIFFFICLILNTITGGNDPDPWESGPSTRGGNWGGPSSSAWDNNFGDGYQQNFGAGPIRGNSGPMRGTTRPGPYNSKIKLLLTIY